MTATATTTTTRVAPSGRTGALDRVALAALALTGVAVGGWALAAPGSFYSGFPGLGRHWVAPDGPFNEHLVRDVGSMYLALGVLAVAALLRADRWTAAVTGVVWLVFSVPHLAYHAGHLTPFGTSDAVLQLVSLSASVVLAAVLLRPRHAGGAR